MRWLLLALLLPSCSYVQSWYAAWVIRHEIESVHREHEAEFVGAIAGQRRMIYQ